MNTIIPPKKSIAQAFSRRAHRYGATAFIQKEILNGCVDLLADCHVGQKPWLDAGCGVGLFGTVLHQRKKALAYLSSDLAFASIQMALKQPAIPRLGVNADLEQLSFKDASFCGVIAASVLQWLDNLEQGITEIARVLEDSGQFIFAVFCEGSFCELSELLAKRGVNQTVHCVDNKEICGLLTKKGFIDISFTQYTKRYYFPTAWAVLKNMSDIGSTATTSRHLAKSDILALCKEYELLHKTVQGVPLSCVIGIGIARKKG